jgi:hypothetical protein
MTALAPVASKIAKLIPLLASHHDGEVVATARAIERTLKSAGLDLHALADVVEHEPTPKELTVYDGPEVGEPTTWLELARWCRHHDDGRLEDHERAFVHDMAARLACGGEPSKRQGAWLRALYAKLCRAGGR